MTFLKFTLIGVAATALSAGGASARLQFLAPPAGVAAPAPSHPNPSGHERHEWRHHRHHHRHHGAVIVAPLFLQGFAPPFGDPAMSPPMPTIVQPAPVYIERGDASSDATAGTAPANVWYYCEATATYYPYVTECAGGWKTVPQQ